MSQHQQNTFSAKLRRVALEVSHVLFPLTGVLFDKTQARYWRAMSIRRMTGVLLGLFFSVGGIAFFIDLTSWQRLPPWALFIYAVLLGGAGVFLFLTNARRELKFIPGVIVFVALLVFSGKWLPHGSEIPVASAARSRIALDAVGLLVAMLLGYRLFLGFIRTQGREQIRIQTELELAQAIQQTLVPTLTYRSAALEAYGLSLPSERVGGDLVDLVSTERGLFAYVADVSGHGIPAGVLMGNLKTALRFGAADGLTLPALLEAVNRVLPAVKQPEMYATLAGMCFRTKGEVEYCVAGHPPILHYETENGVVMSRGMQQFPLGLQAKCDYVSAVTKYCAGDIFMLLSDGILETADAAGSEFGLERVSAVLAKYGAESLREIADALLKEIGSFGPRDDDQTILLMRTL